MITVSSPLADVKVTGNTLVITSDSDITYPEDDIIDLLDVVEDTPIFYESDEVEALVKSCDWSDFMKVKRVKI